MPATTAALAPRRSQERTRTTARLWDSCSANTRRGQGCSFVLQCVVALHQLVAEASFVRSHEWEVADLPVMELVEEPGAPSVQPACSMGVVPVTVFHQRVGAV